MHLTNNIQSQTDTYTGLTPHKVKSSHDELNAADICKPVRGDETGMKECVAATSCPSRTTEPLTPVSSLQKIQKDINNLLLKQWQVTDLTLLPASLTQPLQILWMDSGLPIVFPDINTHQ